MAIMMTLNEAINYALTIVDNKTLARLLNKSPNQVYRYSTNYTKTCSDEVVDKIYDNFKINGEPVLIDLYNSEEEYLQGRAIRESQKG